MSAHAEEGMNGRTVGGYGDRWSQRTENRACLSAAIATAQAAQEQSIAGKADKGRSELTQDWDAKRHWPGERKGESKSFPLAGRLCSVAIDQKCKKARERRILFVGYMKQK